MAKEALQRKTFSASRLDEYASIDGLTKLTGQPVGRWPLVIIKELIDNALDNAENAGVAPVIKVTVGPDGFKVEDNGSGIPAATVKALADYSVRTSSNAAYVAPTRGQQGNALQSILPMGFALDGMEGRTRIESNGRAHTVRFTVDPVRRTPVVNIDASASEVKTGTRVTAYWPDSAASLIEGVDVFGLVDAYRFLNPHAALDLNDDDWEATDPYWSKWKPNQAPSAHWYNIERMRQHMAAEIAHAEDRRKPCPSVRDFLANFRGLSGTAKANEIGAQLKLAERETLRDFFERGDRAIAALISAMRNASRPVKPRDLGVIGEAHLAERLEQDGCKPGSIVYRKAETELDGLPYVIEVAFGFRDDEHPANIIEGFNFTPAVGGSPFSLEGRLASAEVDSEDPLTVVAHVACPRFTFTDKGKTRVALPVEVNVKLTELVTSATKAWSKQKTAEIRDHNARIRRAENVAKKDKPEKQTTASSRHMEEAYMLASADNQYPANKRQIYYAIREAVDQATGGKLTSKYFSSQILPDFLDANPQLTADWDVVADDRGHFAEPHTGKRIGVGTLAVREYIEEIAEPEIADIDIAEVKVVTNGPAGRYGSVLYTEKEGFDPIIEAAGIPEEFDIAPMSCKGMSVIAARTMVEELCAKHGLKLYILRDFDVSGFTIKKTLHTTSKRYTFKRKVDGVDIGLRLEDIEWFAAQGHPLATETVDFGKTSKASVRARLKRDGATDAEIDFLTTGPGNTGQRVELNAMTSDVFVAFVRRKLIEHRVAKVIPSPEMLAETFTALKRGAMAQEALETELTRLNAAAVDVPADLDARVRAYLQANPKATWDAAVKASMEASGKK